MLMISPVNWYSRLFVSKEDRHFLVKLFLWNIKISLWNKISVLTPKNTI